jgi:hypothetical protein
MDPNDSTVHTQTVDGLIGRNKLYYRDMRGTNKYPFSHSATHTTTQQITN